MRFHDYENARSRIIADCQQKKDDIAKGGDLYSLLGTSSKLATEMCDASLQGARKRSNKEVLEHVIRQPPLNVKGGKYEHKCQGDSEREHISSMSEYEWFQLDRPFYNVYPIVEKLVRNTKLQVSAAFLNLPYRTMLFRFPAGHEPHGIKTILLTVGHAHDVPEDAHYFNAAGLDIMRGLAATATVQYTHKLEDESWHDVFTLAALFEDDNDPKNRPYEPRFPLHPSANKEYIELSSKYQALQSPDPSAVAQSYVISSGLGASFVEDTAGPGTERCGYLKSIEDTIAAQHDEEMYSKSNAAHPAYMGYQSREVHEFVFKLATLVSMLHRGDNLIEPIVLAKHQERYYNATDEAIKKWLEDKAARIQGRGFSVGKELNERDDISPHVRNPHMALYWTGPGSKKPVLIFRAGADVQIKKLAQVPTGFLGAERPDEKTEKVIKEYVYFLREPHTSFVKIGRTRRTIAERKKQLETYHGLTLLGYIVTGDCVELETRLHRENAEKRRQRPDGRQSEFFELDDAKVREIVTNYGGTLRF